MSEEARQAAALFFSLMPCIAAVVWVARAEVGNFNREDS